jgi:hypothetical protein
MWNERKSRRCFIINEDPSGHPHSSRNPALSDRLGLNEKILLQHARNRRSVHLSVEHEYIFLWAPLGIRVSYADVGGGMLGLKTGSYYLNL